MIVNSLKWTTVMTNVGVVHGFIYLNFLERSSCGTSVIFFELKMIVLIQS